MWGNEEPWCLGMRGPASSFLAMFPPPWGQRSASHLLLTSAHIPADSPICLSSLVVKDLMGSSACSASALVTAPFCLWEMNEQPWRGEVLGMFHPCQHGNKSSGLGKGPFYHKGQTLNRCCGKLGRMGASCQRSQGGLCLHPNKINGVFLLVSLNKAFKGTETMGTTACLYVLSLLSW